MELLAPAGSKPAFIAAIRGGADSVYVGMQGFNARANSKELSPYDLEVLTHYAHEHGRKIYIAFNTLVKQWEIADAVKALSSLQRLKPDALIVQDMGIARIVREQFPELALHASTQMSAHNSQGAAELARAGFTRVILARELSFSELKLIAARSPVELEVFCHGALCFFVSGMCLFSSSIGGHSGNRGRCTQPCRRIWRGGNEKGYLFSPRDLQLAEQLPKLAAAGVKALKIEGRLRSSDYVYRVVKAYRMLLDAGRGGFADAMEEAKSLLAVDYARAKTTALFSGRDPELINPGRAQCLGLRIGEVTGAWKDHLSLRLTRALECGDRLRIADPRTDVSASTKVKEFTQRKDCCDLTYTGPAMQKGAVVFLAGDAQTEEKSFTKEVDEAYAAFTPEDSKRSGPSTAYLNLLANQWRRRHSSERAERLWVRIDDPAWLPLLQVEAEAADIVLSLNKDNLHAFIRGAKNLPLPAGRFLCELTPYIGQRELPDFRQAVTDLSAQGLARWIVNNVSHFAFFPVRPTELVSGHFLYDWNAYAALAWKELGVSRHVVSWEDDALNIKELCRLALRGHLAVYLYGYPPLGRSRFMTRDMCGEAAVEEKAGGRFRRSYESGSGVLIPEQPVSLFNTRKKLAGFGIEVFGIDLSFISPDVKRWRDIHAGYLDGKNPAASFKFNYKRTVK
ncbi:MAG: peptidase U32 family protein [Elusimicrobiota bacterium]